MGNWGEYIGNQNTVDLAATTFDQASLNGCVHWGPNGRKNTETGRDYWIFPIRNTHFLFLLQNVLKMFRCMPQ